MWTRTFWKATAERMIRGAAVTVFGAKFGGDVVFDAFSVSTWGDVGALAISGAFGSLLLALIGNGVTGTGPAITKAETTN